MNPFGKGPVNPFGKGPVNPFGKGLWCCEPFWQGSLTLLARVCGAGNPFGKGPVNPLGKGHLTELIPQLNGLFLCQVIVLELSVDHVDDLVVLFRSFLTNFHNQR